MTDTIRKQIISNIETALAAVLQAGGYITNAGSHVYTAQRKLDKEEVQSIAVWPGAEEVAREYGANVCSMNVRIEALAMFGSDEPSDAGEDLLGDVIEVMTAPVLTRAFTSGSTEIVVGNTITGAVSGATAYITGVSVTSGTWAGGDAEGTLTYRRAVGVFAAENLNVGASLNVATISATVTASLPVVRVTGSLADDIMYTGGQVVYPEEGERAVGVKAEFTIMYQTRAGNPYAQK